MKVYGQLEKAQAENTAADGTVGTAGRITFNTVDGKLTVDDGSVNRKVVMEAQTQTLTNKTLTAPVINSPTGIVKADVGLGNVDNTSDATKNAAVATLTNKTLTGNKADNFLSNAGAATITLPTVTSTLATLAGTEALTNKDYQGGTASNTSRLTIPGATKATLDGLTRKAGTIVYASDTAIPYIDNGSTLIKVLTGSVPALSVVTPAKTSNYTLATTDDFISGDSSGGTFTLTLPTAVGVSGKVYYLKKTDSSFIAISIATTSAQTIDGVTTSSLNTQNELIAVMSDGSNWQVLDRKIPSVWISDNSAVTTAAGFGTVTNASYFRRRDGDSLRVRGSFSTGTTAATTASLAIGNSLVIDSTKLPAFTQEVGVEGGASSASTAFGANNNSTRIFYDGSDTANVYFATNASSTGYIKINASSAFNNTTKVVFDFLVPISGWKG